MKRIKIEIWADINCPFCYIAETMLDKVLQETPLPDTEIEVYWRSYWLNAELPPHKVVTWSEMLADVSDPAEIARLEEGNRQLEELAAPYGLIIKNEETLLHNSIDAARLLKLANRHQNVLAVARAFGEGFFSQGLDMSDHQHLLEKAIQAGLPADEVEELLRSDLYLDEVEADQKAAPRFAPNFIPTFYFNGGNKVEGVVSEAQLQTALLDAHRQLL